MRVALAVVVLATILATPAIADEVRILSSRGGEVSHFIDLFDPNLGESDRIDLKPGSRALRLDLDAVHSTIPRVLAASAKITGETASATTLRFDYEGIDQTESVVCILIAKPVRLVTLNGRPLPAGSYKQSDRTLLLHLQNTAIPQQIDLSF